MRLTRAGARQQTFGPSVLDKLPPELLGLIYKQLEEREAKALLSTQKSVRSGILAQITTLTITNKQLHRVHTVHPLSCLPAGVCLRKVVVEGDLKGRDNKMLDELLHPRDIETRDKAWRVLQDVKELELQAWWFYSSTMEPQEGLRRLAETIFAPTWTLERLTVDLRGNYEALFFVALSSQPSASQLKHLELYVKVESDEHACALLKLQGLESLSMLDVSPTMDASWLAELVHLKSLVLSPVFPLPDGIRFPPTLKSLEVGRDNVEGLQRLIRCSGAGSLPMLEHVRWHVLDLDSPNNPDFSEDEFSEWLSSRPNFSFVIGRAQEVVSAYADTLLYSFPAQLTQRIQDCSLVGIETLRIEELAVNCPHLKRLDLINCSGIQSVLGLFTRVPGLETLTIIYNPDEFPDGLADTMLALCEEASSVPGVLNREVEFGFSPLVYGDSGWSQRSSDDIVKMKDAWRDMSKNLSKCSMPCNVELTITEIDGYTSDDA